jgi:hypothetical protein
MMAEVEDLRAEVERLRGENAALRGKPMTGEELRAWHADMKRQIALLAELRARESGHWSAPMAQAVPTSVVQDIVRDHRTSVHLPSPPAGVGVVQLGSGWVTPKPLGPVPGVRELDAVARGFDQREKLDLKLDLLVKEKLVRDALARPSRPAVPEPEAPVFKRRV